MIKIGPGLGLASARRFAREGFSVVGLARTPDKLVKEAEIEIRHVDAADSADSTLLCTPSRLMSDRSRF